MTHRAIRTTALVLTLGLTTLLTAGCASGWEKPTEKDGSWCYWFGRSLARKRTETCTPHPVPDLQTDLQAKTFAPDPEAVTLYVVRRSMDDYRYLVPVMVDGKHSVETIPGSYVRMRLQPGSHQLSIVWNGKTADQNVQGKAGDVQVLQVAGLSTDKNSQFSWSEKPADDARQRVLKSKLIRDLDLR
jgi:hypothetical protein